MPGLQQLEGCGASEGLLGRREGVGVGARWGVQGPWNQCWGLRYCNGNKS